MMRTPPHLLMLADLRRGRCGPRGARIAAARAARTSNYAVARCWPS